MGGGSRGCWSWSSYQWERRMTKRSWGRKLVAGRTCNRPSAALIQSRAEGRSQGCNPGTLGAGAAAAS